MSGIGSGHYRQRKGRGARARVDSKGALDASVCVCLDVSGGCGSRSVMGREGALGVCVVLDVEGLVRQLAERGMIVRLYEGVTCCAFKVEELEDWSDDTAAGVLCHTWDVKE